MLRWKCGIERLIAGWRFGVDVLTALRGIALLVNVFVLRHSVAHVRVDGVRALEIDGGN